MKALIIKYKHGWILSYFFLYAIWFYLLEHRTSGHFASIHIFLDDYIPFNEYFIIPYCLWFLYIAATIMFFFFTSKEDFYKTTAFLFTGMTICLIIYTIWPNGQNLRPDLATLNRHNVFLDIVNMIYSNDTSTNVCPSIHVFNSIGANIAIWKSSYFKDKKYVKAFSFVLMISICLSTVFLKQHSVFDGICAILLSCVMYVLVYKVDYSKLRNKSKEKESATAY